MPFRRYNVAMGYEFYDMHCHLDFLPQPAVFAAHAEARGVAFCSSTVTPQGFLDAKRVLGGSPNVQVGAGLHPWWVDDGRCGFDEMELLCSLICSTRIVGEVGLDFGKRHIASRELQEQAFRRVAETCAHEGGKLLSIHAVKSADAVLDELERSGCLSHNQVIMHWFSDSDVALHRAIRAGCYFSVGTRMLGTKRGREYIKLIPVERLLLETDLPPQADGEFPLDSWLGDLAEACVLVEQARSERISTVVAATSARLLGV